MVLSNRGQVMLYGFMMALVIVILALAFAYPIWQSTTDARSDTTSSGGLGLNCSSTTLSGYDKAACITTDMTTFYFVGILVFIGGAVLIAKLVFT
jgi:predicted metal-binding membrane protein